jgi:hypothetical protein
VSFLGDVPPELPPIGLPPDRSATDADEVSGLLAALDARGVSNDPDGMLCVLAAAEIRRLWARARGWY